MNAGIRLGLGARLEQGIDALQIQLPGDAAARMQAYLAELQKWNATYNLTAIRDSEEMIVKHLLDSLVLLPFIPVPALNLVDAGSGAGLPGIPLALARPAWQVTLLDGNGKKARFLRHAVRTLKLDNVTVVEARAEVFHPAVMFDAVISRAFGPLADFLRQTAHLVTRDGQWLAMKGKLDDKELEDIPEGFQVTEAIPLRVPGLDEARHLVRVSRE